VLHLGGCRANGVFLGNKSTIEQGFHCFETCSTLLHLFPYPPPPIYICVCVRERGGGEGLRENPSIYTIYIGVIGVVYGTYTHPDLLLLRPPPRYTFFNLGVAGCSTSSEPPQPGWAPRRTRFGIPALSTGMSTSTQPRQPSGTPVGGQFAGKANPEPPALVFDGTHPVFRSPMGPVTALSLTGTTVQFQDDSGAPVGPPHANVSAARKWGAAQGWPSAPPYTTRQLERLFAAGCDVDDVDSPTRDLRMAARSAVGDLVFVDPDTGTTELLSNAYVLANHLHDGRAGIAPWRVFCHEDAVTVGDRVIPWRDLTSTSKLEHIRGYAEAVTGGDLPSDHGPAYASGWTRGVSVARAAALFDAGDVPWDARVTIVDPDAAFARRVQVDHIAPDPDQPFVYRAHVAAGQYRRHTNPTGGSGTVPWAAGTPIQFAVDAIASP